MTSSSTRQLRRVLRAYVAVVAAWGVYGFAVVEPSARRSELAFAFVFGLLGVAPTIAILRRHRWGWILSVLVIGSAIVLYPFLGGRVVSFILQVAAIALLLSSPMRQYVGIRLGRWRFANPLAKPS